MGLPNCIDCGKKLSSYKAKRCHKCANKKISTERSYVVSERTKSKISKKLKGRSLSEQTKEKMKGRIAWNKNKKYTEEEKKKINIDGLKLGPGWNKGIEKSIPVNSGSFKKGQIPWNWKGGNTLLFVKIRTCIEYRNWRIAIFKRDWFTCQLCGYKERKIEAHHIESFKTIIEENNINSLENALDCEELFKIDKGITLCKKCHLLTRNKEKEYENQFNKIISSAGTGTKGMEIRMGFQLP